MSCRSTLPRRSLLFRDTKHSGVRCAQRAHLTVQYCGPVETRVLPSDLSKACCSPEIKMKRRTCIHKISRHASIDVRKSVKASIQCPSHSPHPHAREASYLHPLFVCAYVCFFPGRSLAGWPVEHCRFHRAVPDAQSPWRRANVRERILARLIQDCEGL